jgi:hypothetical protein
MTPPVCLGRASFPNPPHRPLPCSTHCRAPPQISLPVPIAARCAPIGRGPSPLPCTTFSTWPPSPRPGSGPHLPCREPVGRYRGALAHSYPASATAHLATRVVQCTSQPPSSHLRSQTTSLDWVREQQNAEHPVRARLL